MPPKKNKQDKNDDGAVISKNTALSAVISSMKKKWGPAVVRTADDKEALDQRRVRLNVIHTGSLSFDRLTGVGGIPAGRIIEIHGNKGMFKTSMLLCIAGAAQKQGYFVVFIDAEHRLDVDRAAMLGVEVEDPNKFLLITPESGEQTFATVDKFIGTVDNVFFIIDSVSALAPEQAMRKEIGEGNAPMGSQARLISESLKRIVANLAKTNSILAFTNQYRMQMAGSFSWKGVSGGNALGYYDTYIMEVSWEPKNSIDDEFGQQIGQLISCKMVKNSYDFPKRERLIPVHLKHGFWKELELLILGEEFGFIKCNKPWYYVAKINKDGSFETDEKGEVIFDNLGQGKTKAITALQESPELVKILETLIRKEMGL